ncbi:MAG: glycosyltransferase [Sedimenticola sp.]
MNTKRVLLVSSNSSGRGGGERYLVFLSEGLRSLGFEVHALLGSMAYMNSWAQDLLSVGVQVHRRPLKGLAQRPLRFIQALRDKKQIDRVTELCCEVEPDAILVNQQYDEDGLDYLKGALKAKIAPVVGVIHMPMTEGKNKRPLGALRGNFLRRWYLDNSYRLILVSEGAQQEFESYYPAPRPTAVVNNATPLGAVAHYKREKANASDGLVIGFVGQLVPQKNLSCLLDAWHMARSSGFDCRLLLVGDGPERATIERRLNSMAPSHSWNITGWLAQPEEWLNKMDLFMLSSHFEGLPLSLVEAAGRGIPSVVAPFNGATDVARHAHWVKVADNHSAEAIGSLLIKTLKEWDNKVPVSESDLLSFCEHFSLKRMASEVAVVMGLDEHTCE